MACSLPEPVCTPLIGSSCNGMVGEICGSCNDYVHHNYIQFPFQTCSNLIGCDGDDHHTSSRQILPLMAGDVKWLLCDLYNLLDWTCLWSYYLPHSTQSTTVNLDSGALCAVWEWFHMDVAMVSHGCSFH